MTALFFIRLILFFFYKNENISYLASHLNPPSQKITEACIPCLCFNQCDQKLIEELSRELRRIFDSSNFKAHLEKKIVNGYVAL